MAIVRDPLERLAQAQDNLRGVRERWREAVGLPPEPAPVPADPPRFINLDDVPINRAPPVREEPVWNIPEGGFMMDLEAEGVWGDMQRVMMRDIPQPPPHPDPINRGQRMEIDWGIARPWGGGRPFPIEEEDNMNGKVYGEDYS